MNDSEVMCMPALIMLNDSGVITHATDTALSLLGLRSLNQIIGRPGREFWIEPDRATQAREVFDRHGYWQGSFTARKTDGFPVELLAKAWKLRSSPDSYAISMLLASAGSGDGLFAMFAPQDSVTIPKLILQGMVHDLNNAVMFPAAIMPMLQESIPAHDQAAHESFDQATRACRHLGDMVRQMEEWLTAWTRPTSVRDRAPVDKLVTTAARLAVIGSRVKLKLQVPDGNWEVECNEAAIHRVLVNLILNARQATRANGTVSVTLARELETSEAPSGGGWVTIAITDEGCGVDSSQIEHLFSLGYTTKADGHGVGLAISSHIVREHGGRIDFASVKGVGSTFTIRLRGAGCNLGLS